MNPKRKVIDISHVRIYPEDGALYEEIAAASRPARRLKTLAQEALVATGQRGAGRAAEPAADLSAAGPQADRGVRQRLVESLQDGE